MELKQQRRLANWLHYGKWRIWTQERIKMANYSPQLEFRGSFSVSLRKISEVHGDCFNVVCYWFQSYIGIYCTAQQRNNWIGAQKHNNIDKEWLQFGACVNSLKRPLRPHPSLVGSVQYHFSLCEVRTALRSRSFLQNTPLCARCVLHSPFAGSSSEHSSARHCCLNAGRENGKSCPPSRWTSVSVWVCTLIEWCII